MHRNLHHFSHRFFRDMVGLGTIILVVAGVFILAAPFLLITHPLWAGVTDYFTASAVHAWSLVACVAFWFARRRGWLRRLRPSRDISPATFAAGVLLIVSAVLLTYVVCKALIPPVQL